MSSSRSLGIEVPNELLSGGVYGSRTRTCSTTRLITLGVGRGAGAAGFGAVRRAAGLRAAVFLATARFRAGFFAALFFAARFFGALFFAFVLRLLLRRDDADLRLDALRERLDDFFAEDFDRLEGDFFDRFLVAMGFSPL